MFTNSKIAVLVIVCSTLYACGDHTKDNKSTPSSSEDSRNNQNIPSTPQNPSEPPSGPQIPKSKITWDGVSLEGTETLIIVPMD